MVVKIAKRPVITVLPRQRKLIRLEIVIRPVVVYLHGRRVNFPAQTIVQCEPVVQAPAILRVQVQAPHAHAEFAGENVAGDTGGRAKCEVGKGGQRNTGAGLPRELPIEVIRAARGKR